VKKVYQKPAAVSNLIKPSILSLTKATQKVISLVSAKSSRRSVSAKVILQAIDSGFTIKSMKLSELAEKTFAAVEQADENLEIIGAAGLDIAERGQVTFLANPKYTAQIKTTRATAIFLSANVKAERDDIAVLRAEDAYLAYTRALKIFNPEPEIVSFVHPSAVIDETASVAQDAHISANVVIGANCSVGKKTKIFPNVTLYDRAKIGADCTIHSGVSIRENCEIGNGCIIHNNTTIGSDGFGYAKDEEKRWLKIPQTGRVVIEDDVEIGANTAIDCASVGETRIKRGAKIDNLVQIGHSCTIEEDALICSQTGLAGSSVIGKRVILAGQVGIAGHLRVGDDTVITAKSATSHDVADGKILSGIPAFDNRDWLRSIAAFRRLGEIARAIRGFEKRIIELEQKQM
jgi:UDP-3-O-[3-hydroxymyristoyl] glucosamine N-acyltransferase